MFSSLTENGDIWSLPVDANLGKVTGQPQRVTKEQGAEYYPSVSLDGKTLAFVSHRDGNPDIWTKDLESGKETSTVGTPTVELHPAVSADGFRVAYLSLSQTQGGAIIGAIRVIPVTGGISKELCSSCSWPLDWSSDERRMVFNELHGNQLVRYLMDVPTAKKSHLLDHSSPQIGFSADGDWITFVVQPVPGIASPLGCRIFIAPYKSESIREEQWIPLSEVSTWDDKPRWSPDGNLIYFVSDRDGFACIWAQKLDPKTKRPREGAFAVYHSHESRCSIKNQGYGGLEISVARDKIVFSMVELTGNIWTANLKS